MAIFNTHGHLQPVETVRALRYGGRLDIREHHGPGVEVL
jgi:hypothetical protein